MCSSCCTTKCVTAFALMGSIVIAWLVNIALNGPSLDPQDIGKRNQLCQRLTNTNATRYQRFFTLNDGREIEYFQVGNLKTDHKFFTFQCILSDGSIELM
eukprot:1145507_1